MTEKRKSSSGKRRDPPPKKRAPNRKKARPKASDPADPRVKSADVPPEVAAAFETWMRVRGEAPGPLFLSDAGLAKLGKGLPVTEADGLSQAEVAKIMAAKAARSRGRKDDEREAGSAGDA